MQFRLRVYTMLVVCIEEKSKDVEEILSRALDDLGGIGFKPKLFKNDAVAFAPDKISTQ